MLGNFFKCICYYFLFIIVITIFVTFMLLQVNLATEDYPYGLIDSSDYVWPLPGYSYISSYFGYRDSPTLGASSYHSGIDIPAPEGAKIYSICDGIITFASWGAGGGYTIVVENEGIKVSYCHVSPNFFVYRNQEIKKGQYISNVGPKNVYGIENNPYHDSFGNPTNGATTGCHLHLAIKVNNKFSNPLNFVSPEKINPNY